MATRRRRGPPQEWFHRADGRIPVIPPPGPDERPDGPNVLRKVMSTFHVWMICPLGRCRRARLCLTRREIPACRSANDAAVRPHLAFMRDTLLRAAAEREDEAVIPGRSRLAAQGKGSQGPSGGQPALDPLPGPSGRRG